MVQTRPEHEIASPISAEIDKGRNEQKALYRVAYSRLPTLSLSLQYRKVYR